MLPKKPPKRNKDQDFSSYFKDTQIDTHQVEIDTQYEDQAKKIIERNKRIAAARAGEEIPEIKQADMPYSKPRKAQRKPKPTGDWSPFDK